MKLILIILATAALTAVAQYFVVSPRYQYMTYHRHLPREMEWIVKVDTWTGKTETLYP